MSSLSDAEVIRRILGGEQHLYALLVRRHQERLYRYALGLLLDADDAADVVQDSLVKAYTALESCTDRDHFGAWAHRIVANRCRDHLKDIRRRTVELTDDAFQAPPDDQPDRQLDRSELNDRVQWALAQLPEAQREAFVLKHVQGLSYEEMGEVLGASVSALKMRVMRAREALQALLEPAR